MSTADRRDFRVAILGAGFGGLGMAIRLKQAGMDDFVVLERDEEVGGTWWANTYPGCQCDVPSHLYSYSFALNPNWTRTYSLQPEIRDYLRDLTDRYGVRAHLRVNCTVEQAEWDDEEGVWRLDTSDGPISARVVVAAPGPLSEPSFPELPGHRGLRGGHVPHRALEPRARPDRAQGGGGRHRGERDPDRAADPADRRARDRLPAHAAVGRSASRLARSPASSGGSTKACRRRSARFGPRCTSGASCS